MSVTILMHAAKVCDCNEIRHLVIVCGLDINAQDQNGNTVLHWIAMASANTNLASKSLKSIALALQLGAQRDASNKYGLTPVHVAARLGSKVALQALIQNFSNLREDRLLQVAQHFSPVISAVKTFFGADRATLFLVDEARKKLTASVATVSDDDRHGVLHIDLEWTQGVIGLCFQTLVEDNNSEMDQRPKKWVRCAGYPDTKTSKYPLRVLVSVYTNSFMHGVVGCV